MIEALVLAVVGFAGGGFLWFVLNPKCPRCERRFLGLHHTTRHVIRCPYCDYWEALDD